jgi:hypothetical protein
MRENFWPLSFWAWLTPLNMIFFGSFHLLGFFFFEIRSCSLAHTCLISSCLCLHSGCWDYMQHHACAHF